MTIAQRAVRGTALVLASSYTNMGLGLLYGIVMARLLEPEHFGLFALGTFFFTLLDVRGKLSLEYAYVHRQPTTGDLIATHALLQIALALASVGIAAAAAAAIRWLGLYPPPVGPIMLALALATVVEAAGATPRYELEKQLAFGRSTLVITGSLLLSYLAAAGMALLGYRHWALVGQVIANAVLGGLGFWWAYRRLSPQPASGFRFDRGVAGWMLRYGATVAVGSVAIAVLLQFDNFLVGTFVSASALGYYALAYKVAQWPTGLVTHIIARTSLPTYARLQDDPARLSKAFDMSLWLILSLAVPIALAFFVAAPDFLRLLYGDKWLPSAILLRLLVGYSVLRPLLDDTSNLFRAIGRPQRMTVVLVAQALVLVAVATPLTLRFAAGGTAVGVGVAFAVGVVLAGRFVSQTLPIRLGRPLFTALAAAAVGLAAYAGAARLVDLEALEVPARVAAKGALVAGGYMACLLALQGRDFVARVRYVVRLLRA